MKHKRETGEKEEMIAMTKRRHRVHRAERDRSERMSVCLFVCLFTYLLWLLERTKRIDRYRSTELHHHQSSISGGRIGSGGGGGSSSSSSSSSSIKEEEEEEELPWLIK